MNVVERRKKKPAGEKSAFRRTREAAGVLSRRQADADAFVLFFAASTKPQGIFVRQKASRTCPPLSSLRQESAFDKRSPDRSCLCGGFFLQKTKTDRPRLWRNSVGGPFFMKKAQLKWKVGKMWERKGGWKGGERGTTKRCSPREREPHIKTSMPLRAGDFFSYEYFA